MSTQPPHHPPPELVAAALRTYRALTTGCTQPVPFTAPGPEASGALGLAVFLTVYADAQQETPDPKRPRFPLERPWDVRRGTVKYLADARRSTE
ncbi:hypothetical protein GCM10022384_57850 [Streptomyces marokkonensis]|uniref:Uncharacterized protein n=1 Tax=Streptomyces marokkonensis TaxID=324855 RepID=A0ABP7RY51_9ACTN